MVNRAPVAYTLEPFATAGPQAAFTFPATGQEGAFAFPPPPVEAPFVPGVPQPQPGYPAPGGYAGPGQDPAPYPYPGFAHPGGAGPAAPEQPGGQVAGPPAGYPGQAAFAVPSAPMPAPGGAHPQHWAPPPYPYPVPPPQPPPGGSRRSGLLLIPAAVVVVLALVVVGLVVLRGKGSPSTRSSGAATSPTAGVTATGAGPSTAPQTQSPPSPTPPDPNEPDGALALSDQAATTRLEQAATAGRGAVQAQQGKWVPQVDGKCVGIAVDIGPNWVPDGTIDTQSVTVQQILGFHISLEKRFGAVTAYQTEVGAAADTASSGPCQGKVVWFSVVPQGYGSPDEANAWCAANVAPVKECEARYVARPGEKTDVKHRY